MDPNISNQPTQPNSEQQPVNKTSGSKDKFKLILLIIIGLLIVGSGGYYLLQQNKTNLKAPTVVTQTSPTPTPDPTASWKTYTSKNNVYSIKYPQDWYVYEYKQSGGIGISNVSNPENISQTDSSQKYTSIMVSELLPNTFIFKDTVSKQFTLKYYTGLRRNQTTSYGLGEVVNLHNPNGGNDIEITKYIDTNNMFDQILSTFKFVDQNQAAIVSANKFIQNYYNAYLACLKEHVDNTSGKSSEQDCPHDVNAFTQTLYSQPQNINLFCAQNIPLTLIFDKADILPNKMASVIVRTIWESGPPGNIDVGLQSVDNQWKITSITCSK